jgi:hypothetical protein
MSKLFLCNILQSYSFFFRNANRCYLKGLYMVIISFWDIETCSLIEVDRRFRVSYCLDLQSDGYSKHELFTVAVYTVDVNLSYTEIGTLLWLWAN